MHDDLASNAVPHIGSNRCKVAFVRKTVYYYCTPLPMVWMNDKQQAYDALVWGPARALAAAPVPNSGVGILTPCSFPHVLACTNPTLNLCRESCSGDPTPQDDQRWPNPSETTLQDSVGIPLQKQAGPRIKKGTSSQYSLPRVH